MVLFCLTTQAECPSLAAGKGLATVSLVVDLPARPLVLWWATQALYYNQRNSWLGVRKSEFWTSRYIQCSWTEKQSSQTRGEINIFASSKSITTPSPGGLSHSSTCSGPGNKPTEDWVRILGGSQYYRAELPGSGFQENKNFELCFEGGNGFISFDSSLLLKKASLLTTNSWKQSKHQILRMPFLFLRIPLNLQSRTCLLWKRLVQVKMLIFFNETCVLGLINYSRYTG